MTNQKRTRKFVFGNEKFGGSYTPGDFELNFPEDMTREDFEKIFNQKMNSLYKRGHDLKEEFFDNDQKRKQNLKPLSIRVKPHTKEFFKNHSLLSPREVLEMYEEFNNGSEAFINSLLEEEKELENELTEIQEKLHNAKLFREKLGELKPENGVLTDNDKLLKLKQKYDKSEVKNIGNETSTGKAENDIINDIQIYNTQIIRVYDEQVISIGVYTNAEPVIYYFKNEYSKDDIKEILNRVEEYCKENEIEFSPMQNSLFLE
ncbi:MAG: hypothetical protein J6P09_03540 [Methanobrevibacter sp.]|nr:hypothetical protein [Methanobrevibacter sp.]